MCHYFLYSVRSSCPLRGKHHEIPQDQVLFNFQNAPLQPQLSPKSVGWQKEFGILEIEAAEFVRGGVGTGVGRQG